VQLHLQEFKVVDNSPELTVRWRRHQLHLELTAAQNQLPHELHRRFQASAANKFQVSLLGVATCRLNRLLRRPQRVK
jgi:hypothetical protein